MTTTTLTDESSTKAAVLSELASMEPTDLMWMLDKARVLDTSIIYASYVAYSHSVYGDLRFPEWVEASVDYIQYGSCYYSLGDLADVLCV